MVSESRIWFSDFQYSYFSKAEHVFCVKAMLVLNLSAYRKVLTCSFFFCFRTKLYICYSIVLIALGNVYLLQYCPHSTRKQDISIFSEQNSIWVTGFIHVNFIRKLAISLWNYAKFEYLVKKPGGHYNPQLISYQRTERVCITFAALLGVINSRSSG